MTERDAYAAERFGRCVLHGHGTQPCCPRFEVIRPRPFLMAAIRRSPLLLPHRLRP